MPIYARRELFANITLATIYAFFLARNFAYLTYEFRWSVMILTIFSLIVLVISIIRRPPQRVSLHPFDVIVTLIGTYSPILMAGIGTQQELFLFQVVGGLGLIISLIGLVTLNKSFGLLPADRGIVNTGIYRIVRHPIYAGYFISNSCFIIQNCSLWNIACFSVFVTCETLRLIREEKLLCQNPEYTEYTQQTRWRIIPFVW